MKAFVLSGGGNLGAGVRALWQPMPSVTRFGLALAGIGVAADFVHHVFTHDLHAAAVVHIDVIGHVLTLAGMVLALSGVIHAAVESRRRTRQKGESNAASRCSAVAR